MVGAGAALVAVTMLVAGTWIGFPVEARIGTLIADMPVPYCFVPGTQDSQANRAALDASPNVTLLDGQVVDVPLVIAGNSHRRSDRVADGTRILTVGSTGATGVGALTVEADLPYEAQILRFRAGRLAAIDYVTFEGTGGDYTVSRRVVTPIEASSRVRNSPTTSPQPGPSTLGDQ